jgi:hypothetical protein
LAPDLRFSQAGEIPHFWWPLMMKTFLVISRFFDFNQSCTEYLLGFNGLVGVGEFVECEDVSNALS